MKRAFRRSAAGIAVVGAVALIAGCGGGSDDTLSADEFRAQADAICADTNRETDAIASPTSAGELLQYLKDGQAASATGLEKLKALKPPSDLDADWQKAIDLQDQRTETIDGAITRIEGGEDPETVVSDINDEVTQTNDELDGLAQDLGLKVCGADDENGTDTTTSTDTTPTDTTLTDTTGSTDTSVDILTTGNPEVDQYVNDAKAAAGALTEFGQLLQAVTSPADLKAKAPEAQQSLDEFDEAIAKLDGYTLDNATLEKQRAGLVREGPAVSDVLRRFVDAAAAGDEQAVQALLPEVMTALQNFSSAATDIS